MRTFLVFSLFFATLKVNVVGKSGLECNFPYVPRAGNATLVSYGQSSRFLRYRCDEGRYLIGGNEKNCLDEGEGGPICAVDALREVGVARVFAGSTAGIQPGKVFDGTGNKIHQGYRCAATAVKGGNSWLKIDLGMALKVLSVNISLAEDSEVPKTMELRLGNDSDHRNNPLCQWLTERSLKEAQSRFLTLDCPEFGRFVSLHSSKSLVVCDMKVLVDDLASQLLPRDQCPDYDDSAEKDNYDSDLFTFRSRCIRISNKKMSFLEGLSFCRRGALQMWTNEETDLYDYVNGNLIRKEALRIRSRPQRELFWIGAKMEKNVWRWINNNGGRVEHQPWGLGEPGGDDCAVVDSALKYKWNSVRCVISARAVCAGYPDKCAAPEIKSGTRLSSETPVQKRRYYSKGDKVRYECAMPGYGLKPDEVARVCLDNGEWSGKAPDCVESRLLTQKLNPNNNAIINITTTTAAATTTAKKAFTSTESATTTPTTATTRHITTTSTESATTTHKSTPNSESDPNTTNSSPRNVIVRNQPDNSATTETESDSAETERSVETATEKSNARISTGKDYLFACLICTHLMAALNLL